MATPIIVNPTKPSQVLVNGTQKSGTPITINTDLDYTRVQSMIGEALGEVKIDTTDLAKEQTLIDKAEEIKQAVENAKPEIDTTELASKDLERFWDVVPEDSEEIISEEDIHAAVEDIWIQTFNS